MKFGYQCDEPMAKRKFLFPCDHDCRNCVAGMKFVQGTGWVHMPAGSLDKFMDKKLYERNMNIISELIKAVIK